MNPTTQSPTNSVHPARQQRILRLPADSDLLEHPFRFYLNTLDQRIVG
ncbi:hypothetical protein GII14_19915 [Shewanella chilikensis]|uniref:Uncharacterized protein n=1 Tax=Shewanella chilikensis TaxID=558541 RepID=A0A6G7LWL8_9GAMM|nr:hypothetical protein GII14_19915 [Shewanella chilikensis]